MRPRPLVTLAALAGAATALLASDERLVRAQSPVTPWFLTQPLITGLYTADPSAHVFDGRIYVYPSHDIDAGVPADDLGSHFAMRDYHVFSMAQVGGPVTDHGIALSLEQVRWAKRQLWAPDAAQRDGRYYLYFPAKDAQDVFRIGVAVGNRPAGPFTPDPTPIAGTYSIDPAAFRDGHGAHYLYFGGIWGGQLQRWRTGTYEATDTYPAADAPALMPKVARLAEDMRNAGRVTARRADPRRARPSAHGQRQRTAILRGGVGAPPRRPLLSLVLDRRHALHRLRDGRLALRALHLSWAPARAGARLDDASLDRRDERPVVPLLPRRADVERPDALA